MQATAVVPSAEGQFEIEDRDNWLQYLEENGYVVIKNVASCEQRKHAIGLLWDFLEAMPGGPKYAVKRDDSSTWHNQAWFPSSSNGLANGYGIGQSQFLWFTRLLPKIEEAFHCIWGEHERLLVSYDGGNVFRSYKYHPGWKTKGGWWHVDQSSLNPSGKGKVCFQGLLSYLDANERTGGLCVIPGSHKYHDELCERNEYARQMGPDASDFVMIPEGDDILSVAQHRLVCCSAGDFIIWDSRTVHCNSPALVDPVVDTGARDGSAGSQSESESVSRNAESTLGQGDKAEHTQAAPEQLGEEELIRVVAYVCMTPAKWATDDVLQRRREAYVFNESTSHWPHRFFSAGGKAGASWIPQNDPARISSKQRQLIGFPDRITMREYMSSLWKRMF